LHLVGETIVRVDHALLALPGSLIDDLREVVSHPQAIAQCEEFLSALDVTVRAEYNTAGAAKRIAENRLDRVAAIPSRPAARPSVGVRLLRRRRGCGKPARDGRGTRGAERARDLYATPRYLRRGAAAEALSRYVNGASRARTGDLVHAMHALSQLSYGPASAKCSGEFEVLRPVHASSLIVLRRSQAKLNCAAVRKRVE